MTKLPVNNSAMKRHLFGLCFCEILNLSTHTDIEYKAPYLNICLNIKANKKWIGIIHYKYICTRLIFKEAIFCLDGWFYIDF